MTAGYQLVKAGVEVEIFEASDSVGGMAKSIPLWGQLVDLGPHRFFSSDPRVNRLWLELVGDQYSMVKRLTRIYYKETFFDYPLKPFNALRGLGMFESLRCILSYLAVRITPPKDVSTFEGWVTSRFGARLFGIFFKSYSEKLWGISCNDLDSDFAAQRIKKLSLFEAVKAALIGTNGSKHKTLVDEFAYPHGGAGFIYERMARRIGELGGQIRLSTPVNSIQSAEGSIGPTVNLVNGQSQAYDHVISTMPITALVQKMNASAEIVANSKSLTFRNTILVYLLIEGESPFPDQWIYIHSSNLKTGRITNFRNWVPSINQNREDTILCLEYWCYDGDEVWTMPDEILISNATSEIYQTRLIKENSVKNGYVVKVPKCYPVYATGYKKHLKPIEGFLSQQRGLSVIGRYGSFKYNNQDHSILMGLLAAENILHDSRHNLWELNTDYEYQESSRITSTGLIVDDNDEV